MTEGESRVSASSTPVIAVGSLRFRDRFPGRVADLLLLASSLLVALVAGEIALRAVRGRLLDFSIREEYRRFLAGATPAIYDSQLGWVPRQGYARKGDGAYPQVTVLAEGFRSNGRVAPIAKPDLAPLLAVGDSFTWGDGVADDETWPAILETLLGRRVINGGVFGYGIDQAYLRAQRLLQATRPETLIFSFISDDIHRASLAVRNGAGKPYFAIEGGRLMLRNVPVPQMSRDKEPSTPVQDFLGHSIIAHTLLMNHRFNSWYLLGILSTVEVQAHDEGGRVACMIFADLARLAAVEDVSVFVLIQYSRWETDETREAARQAAVCAAQPGITVVDLTPELSRLREDEPRTFESYYSGHMSARGNAFVASRLRDVLLAPRP